MAEGYGPDGMTFPILKYEIPPDAPCGIISLRAPLPTSLSSQTPTYRKEKKKDKQINIIWMHIKQRRIEGTAVRISFNQLVISYQARMRLSIDCVISALECAPRKKREGDLNTYSGVYVN